MIFYKRIVRVKQEPVIPEPEVIELDNATYDWTIFSHENNQQEEIKESMIFKGNYTSKMSRLEYRQMQYIELKLSPKLPNMVDLRSSFGQVFDQKDFGSSVSCAIVSLVNRLKPGFQGSRLFLQYNERIVKTDQSSSIREGIMSLMNFGICEESSWPYVEEEATNRPPVRCYKEALKNQIFIYKHIPQDLYVIRNVLNQKIPFIATIQIFESFETENTLKTGIIPVPNTKNEKSLGNHTIVICGYDDSKQQFLCRNSFGLIYPLGGHFWTPYIYLLDSYLSSDLYTILSYEK